VKGVALVENEEEGGGQLGGEVGWLLAENVQLWKSIGRILSERGKLRLESVGRYPCLCRAFLSLSLELSSSLSLSFSLPSPSHEHLTNVGFQNPAT
jgi:hypothetical protein